MYGDSQHVQSTHKGGGGTPALRTTMRLWHLWLLQRGKHLEGWFWLCASLLSPSGFVSFHVCPWIFAWSSYHHSAVTCVMCVQMWRLVDFSAILGCESTLTGMDGLASELQGPPGSDPSVLDYRHCNWLLHGARVWTQVHMAVQQALYRLSHLSRPATLENVTKDCPFSIHYYMVKTITGWHLSTLNDSDATNGDVTIIKQQRGILFSSILLHIQGRKAN